MIREWNALLWSRLIELNTLDAFSDMVQVQNICNYCTLIVIVWALSALMSALFHQNNNNNNNNNNNTYSRVSSASYCSVEKVCMVNLKKLDKGGD